MSDERERYRLLGELFERARGLPADERAAFLEEACADDSRLGREVLELIESYEDPGGPLPPWESDAEWTSEWTSILERLHRHRARESRYRIEAQIGKGGQGVVYRVWDEDLGRPLAMKLTLQQTPGSTSEGGSMLDARSLGRFLDEARITGRLDHPGIVPVHELGLDDDGRVFFTMRLVQGMPFGQAIDHARHATEGWSLPRALESILKACDAMAYAHDRGVIHRDLKPSNIMVGRFGETYVLDWGLGRFLDQPDERDVTPDAQPETDTGDGSGSPPLRTRDGDVIGTPFYMAPEQARGDRSQIDEQTDVYAMGAVLYELLSGRPPYGPGLDEPAPSAFAVVRRIEKGPPTPLLRIDHDVPPELIAICEHAMERRKEDRFASMSGLAAELRAFLEGRVVQSYRTGPLVELQKWVRRNKLVAGSLAALVLVLLSAGLFASVQERRRARLVERNRDEHAAENLVAELERSWPMTSSSIPSMRRWLEEAEDLSSRLPKMREELERLERQFVSAPLAEPLRDPALESRSRELEILRNYRSGFAELLTSKRQELRDASSDNTVLADELQREIVIMEGEIEDFEARIEDASLDLERALALQPIDSSLQLQLAEQLHLVQRVERVASNKGVHAVRRRLEQTLALTAPPDASLAARWSACIEDMADEAAAPRYDGWTLAPQRGLAPLRRDPESGLWEFWHRASGEEPRLGPDERWVISPETGLVLVLMPAGTFRMGAQSTQPNEPNYVDLERYPELEAPHSCERPVHEVSIEAYFLSKYELTQAQWKRLTGTSPSLHFAGKQYKQDPRISRTHPVEHVSYEDSEEALRLWSLEVPTEAQWEFAARCGSSDPYTSPAGFDAIARQVNFADTRGGDRMGNPRPDPVTFDDGWAFHAPVDALLPNPNGFHHILGNVWEWCRDWTNTTKYTKDDIHPVTGEHSPKHSRTKAIRGGSFISSRADLRLSRRVMRMPIERRENLGIRPGRSLDS